VCAVPADRSAENARAGVIALDAPISPAAAKALLRRAGTLLGAGGCQELICDVRGRPDLSLISVLARLALMTRRSCACLRIRSAGTTGQELADLVTLVGLECLDRLDDRLDER
jgi:hypothetical protein